MGSINKAPFFSAGPFILIFIFCLGAILPLAAQSSPASGSVLLAAELEKLEKANPAQKHDALIRIAKLSQLSGNKEKAAQAFYDAAYLDQSKRDDDALLSACRIYVALGEYEKAESGARALLASSQDPGILTQTRLLQARLETFKKNDTQSLVPLASDPAYIAQRPEIYYTLWQISGSSSWKSKLLAEYPQSPEARMASGAIAQASTPQWLLFPGRDSLVSAPVSVPEKSVPTPASAPVSAAGMLQTGLYSREANAQALAERLTQAGFQPQISPRNVRGSEYWAVLVPPGASMSATIEQLKNAGFESFPVVE